MADGFPTPDIPGDEAAEYLRIYVDETAEQAEALVEALLHLERDPHDQPRLGEAFRLIHSVKGSAALLGIDRIATVAHHLETHFERLRSGARLLDPATTNVALAFVDYLRVCNDHLRRGAPLPSNVDLLAAVAGLSAEAGADGVPGAGGGEAAAPATAAHAPPGPRRRRVSVRFPPGMALADLKAELILARLAETGAVVESDPPSVRLEEVSRTGRLVVWVDGDAADARLRGAADVDGVADVEVTDEAEADVAGTGPDHAGGREPAGPADTAAGGEVQETVRVETGRLDVLMNLAGELVVNRSRFIQVARHIAPTFRAAATSARSTAIVEDMRHVLESLREDAGSGAAALRRIGELDRHLAALEEQSRGWQEGRRHFDHLVEAIDQLTRVSDSLQRGVLNTRMVTVAPLFNRFRRSVRDIARELGKLVDLEIHGEKTELDKRMIDEIADPLVHLVRNAIDHGVETPEERRRRGKPERARLRLEAYHRGNAVCIAISDDGAGIDIERIRRKAVDRGLLPAETAAGLPTEDLVDYIWQPGFSTAREVSDISGRGVGMDIVRTRINRLNGSVEVDTRPREGTTFTIRLPLTLAIARCMLFGLPQGVFAVPIENIRGIVAVEDSRIVAVNGRHACEIRGEFLPLVDIQDIFRWGEGRERLPLAGDVAVLQAAGRSIGLRVGTLLGSQDVVVKSLDDNFRHVRGLGGASILGDGSVCLLLDVATAIELAGGRRTRPAPQPT